MLLLSDEYRLEMETTDPGVQPIVEDYERFMATESTVAGLDPSRIELTSPAFFVIRVAVPTCELHGSITSEGNQRTLQIELALGHDPCEYSPAADKAAQAFFSASPVASRSGDVLDVVGTQGAIRFRLATADDPPLAPEDVVPPPLVIPDQPDRSLPAEAGRPSVPWFSERAGSTASGKVVESGATATVDQYRYGSSDPNTWNRLVVWLLERNGATIIAEVAYPEFPEDSSLSDSADTRNQFLTGLDPIELLSDVRFFD